VEKPKGELPNNCTGAPIPKIGYFGWKTWELRFEGTRAPVQADASLNDGRGFQSAAKMLGIARAHTRRAPSDWRRPHSIMPSLCQGARAVRPPDLGFPGHSFQDRHHGNGNRGGATAHVLHLRPNRCRSARRAGDLDGEVFRSEMSERVTSEALQILGGAGYTTLHPVERYWRDARVTKIFEGTSEIQQRIISDVMWESQHGRKARGATMDFNLSQASWRCRVAPAKSGCGAGPICEVGCGGRGTLS